MVGAGIHRNMSPAVAGIGATLLLGGWVVCTLLQVQTTQMFVLLGTNIKLTTINWGLFQQLPQLFMGELTGDLQRAAVIGWGVEIVTLIFTVSYEVLVHAVSAANKRLGGYFGTLSLILVGLNGYTDFIAFEGNFWAQLLYSIVVVFFTVYGLVGGIRLLEVAITDFRR